MPRQSTSNQHSRSPKGQTSYLPATLLAPSPSRASTAARSVKCRAAIANREKQKARPRYAGERAAACVSPQSGQTLRERCTARFSTSRSERDSGTKEKVRVHLRCFEMKPAIFSMSNLVSLPFQRRPPRNNEPSRVREPRQPRATATLNSLRYDSHAES